MENEFQKLMAKMKYRNLQAIILVSMALFTNSHSTEIEWFKTYGGLYLDEAISIQVTADGGFLAVGYTYNSSTSGSDIYLIKTNSAGELNWHKAYGSMGDDWANCIQSTADGGYIIAGGCDEPEAEENDVCLIKIDATGQKIWQRTYGGPGSEEANSVIQTSDGGYLLIGWTDSFGAGYDDIYLLRVNSTGDSLWAKTFGSIFYDKGFSAVETSDGGFLIVSGLGYFGYYPIDTYLIRMDENGDTLWTSSVGGSYSDACCSIIESNDSGYLLAGWTMSFGAGQHDVFVIKIDTLGQMLWHKAYGGANSDVGRSINPTSDGGSIVTGYTQSFGAGGYDLYIIRNDYKGDSLWTETFGGANSDYGWSAIQSADGGFVAAGWTNSFGEGSRDILLVKFQSDLTGVDDKSYKSLPDDIALKQNYPNPFNSFTVIPYFINSRQHVTMKIYDLLGREIGTPVNDVQEPGFYEVVFDASALASGVYLYSLQSGSQTEIQKMILLK